MKAKKTATVSERLVQLMRIFDIRQIDICKNARIDKSSMSQYVNGNRNMKQNTIDKIAQTYNINPTWLMGYDVPMSSPDSDKYINLLCGMINKMDDDKKSKLLDYAEYLSSRSWFITSPIFDCKESTKRLKKSMIYGLFMFWILIINCSFILAPNRQTRGCTNLKCTPVCPNLIK